MTKKMRRFPTIIQVNISLPACFHRAYEEEMLKQLLHMDASERKRACMQLNLLLEVSWSLLRAMPKDVHLLALISQQLAVSLPRPRYTC